MAYVTDTSAARLNLLHTLFVQQLANQLAAQPGAGHIRPMPPLREPQTSNPFGRLMPTGGLTASATHGAGYTAGGTSGRLAMVGAATPTQGGAINWFGPNPGGATGGIPSGIIGGPAVRPPAGLPPLPGH